MPAVKIAENVYQVGAVDRDIREFHGYTTPNGTTYNAYLVLDDKITLIDTVKPGFFKELIDNISEVVDPSKIDYLISNHAEQDHSGVLPEMCDTAKKAVVIGSPNDEKNLKLIHKREFPFRAVKSGDTLCTGKYSFLFTLSPMVHWPDNMVTYMPEQNILFSNDAFGQHTSRDGLTDKDAGHDRTIALAKDYYANIVMPYGAQVQKLLKEASSLDIRMIAPSHGVILTDTIEDMLKKYDQWSKNETDKSLAVIVYDTMWGATGDLAAQIADKLAKEGVKSRILCLKEHHISDCMDALTEADVIAVGSPTLNRSIMPSIAAFLTYMKGLAPKNRKGIAFGAYGWSGESVIVISDWLESCGFDVTEKIRVQYKV